MIKIPDIFQLNDWESKKFLRMMVAIHMLMLGTIGFDFIDMEIPILRQVVGFVYLTFVPGIIILKILKIHRLGSSETFLFSIGLSISFLMFSGFFINLILTSLNIDSPLSFWHVLIFITAPVIILCILSNKTDKFCQNEPPHLGISGSALYLMLLPVLSIVGTYLINFHNNNIGLLILIGLIAMVPVLVAFKRITSELYPLAIVVIAISLLFHRSLISMYLTGYDIHQEYYFHKLVVDNSYWNPNINHNVNAMLSIIIVPAVYSYFLKMNGDWVFKIVFPIIFSLIPLGLYCIYQRQIKNENIAFFSVFFFMSFFTFFTEMLSLARQEIAELFFVLLIFLMVQDTINENVRNILMLIFAMSLITSHYGLSYIVIILMIFIYLFSTDLMRTSKNNHITLPEFSLKKITFNYFLEFFIVFSFLWYIFVSSSSAFRSIVIIGDHIYQSIFTEFFYPESRDRYVLLAVGMADPVVSSFGRIVYRDLQFITQFLIIIGFFKIIISREFSKLKAEYFYLIAASLAILVLAFLPYSAKSLNMSRVYHIALFALSPLLIIGGLFVIEKSLKLIKINNNLKQNHNVSILILGILIPYFLFNSGFVYELTRDSPTSMSLGMERMKNDNITNMNFYNTYTDEKDVYSSRWYYYNKNENKKTFADMNSRFHVLYSYGMTPISETYSPFKRNKLYEFNFRGDYYLYLNSYNVCEDIFVDSSRFKYEKSIFSSLFNKSSRVYSNGCGEIYEK